MKARDVLEDGEESRPQTRLGILAVLLTWAVIAIAVGLWVWMRKG